MLFLLIGAFYTTIVCWLVGNIALKQTAANTTWQNTFSIRVITGLAICSFIAGCWSLLAPLGKNYQHYLLIPVLAVYWLGKKPHKDLGVQLSFWKKLSLVEKSLITICTLLLLLMASWHITHPDTLGYHANIVSWINAYKVVPGLANIQLRLGYQGQWYPSISFFSFNSAGKNINGLNYTFCFWVFLFFAEELAAANSKQKLGLLLLLATMFCSYTQLRLTATSASPDFVAAALASWIFYQALTAKHNHKQKLVLLFICITAVTYKLSVLFAVLFLAHWLVQCLQKKAWTPLLKMMLIAFVTAAPFLIRNTITTGYLLFPVPQSGISALAWKVPQQKVVLDQAYIKAYARSKVEYNKEAIEAANNQPPAQWLPNWWMAQLFADKILLAAALIALLYACFTLKRRRHSNQEQVYLITALCAGLLFWLLTAPDPRFGFAHLIPALYFFPLPFGKKAITIFKKMTLALMISGLVGYTGYRFYYYWNQEFLLMPAGIAQPYFATKNCNGIVWKQTTGVAGCRGLAAPCISGDCSTIIQRGTKPEDGFLPK